MIDFSYVIVIEIGLILGWWGAKLEYRAHIKKAKEALKL
jgi:hypothetical protein|tara:strand:+ start:114 stop:230 length:117 start_codon:yes stop_codon:yes gene_type:complete